MCSVSVVTVVFIHTMEDDQRLNTLVHEGVVTALSLQTAVLLNKAPNHVIHSIIMTIFSVMGSPLIYEVRSLTRK